MGVPHNYAILFLEKNTVKNDRVALHPFFFNDTEHMTSQRHWLAVNVAYWSCVYREAESQYQQVEALASIRSMYYIAGSLGAGEIKALIQNGGAIPTSCTRFLRRVIPPHLLPFLSTN